MVLFEPVNYIKTDTNQGIQFGIGRYIKPATERRDFLPNEEQQTTVPITNTPLMLIPKSNENLNRPFSSVTNPGLNVSAVTLQKGADIYRRNNELNSRDNAAQFGNVDSYQWTFPGIFSQKKETVTPFVTPITQNTQIFQPEPPAQPSVFSKMNNAVQQYKNMDFAVSNTNDLLSRGLDVYQKTRNLTPALMDIPQSNTLGSGKSGLAVPPSLNTIKSRGITEYLIFNAPAEKNTNPFDLYLKAGPMRLLETQLFV